MRTGWKIALSLIVSLLCASLTPTAKAVPTWTEIYELQNAQRKSGDTTFDYVPGYEKGGNAYTNFVNSGASWDLIRIRIQFTKTSNSTLYYVDAYFDKWAGAQLTDLQFPDHDNSLSLQKNVTNLNITSNYTVANDGVKTGTYALGRIEFWPYNYSGNPSGILPAGGTGFDWDDTPAAGTSGHGSYQFFNLTDTQTVFAWNRHRYADASGPELGLGVNNTGTGNYDWTFNNTTWNATNFKVQVYVGSSITIGTIGAPSFTGNLNKGAVKSLIATTNGPGQVTFYFGGKRIAGCIRKNLTGSASTWNATCSFKPSRSGQGSLFAIYQPASSSYTGATSSIVSVRVLPRAGTR